MKKTIAVIIAVLFVFALASLAIAAEEKKAAPVPAEKKAEKTKKVVGEITKIDKEKNAIVITSKINNKVTEATVTVDDKTKIMMGKDKKAIRDLKVGDKVEVEADAKGASKSIMIKPAEKKAGSEKPVKKKKTKAVTGC